MNKSFFFKASETAYKQIEQAQHDFELMLASTYYLRNAIMCKGGSFENVADDKIGDSINVPRVSKKAPWTLFRWYYKRFSWEDQEVSLTWTLINNACCIFEAWLEELLTDVSGLPGFVKKDSIIKELQYPESYNGALEFLKRYYPCDDLRIAFVECFKMDEKYSVSQLQKLLEFYRVFKEMRNCYMHFGYIADKKTFNVYERCQKLVPSDLNMKVMPVINVIVEGQKIIPHRHGAIGLTDAILRIIRTYDTELIGTTLARSEFCRRFREVGGEHKTIKANAKKAEGQIAYLLRRIWKRKLICNDYGALRKILKSEGLSYFA